jgi:hypothetical protein
VNGIRYTPAGSTGHQAIPLKGTWLKQDGTPADLLRSEDYPITARCQACGNQIRLDYLLQWEWRHLPAAAAVPVLPAGDTP